MMRRIKYDLRPRRSPRLIADMTNGLPTTAIAILTKPDEPSLFMRRYD